MTQPRNTHGGPRPNQTGRPPKEGPTVIKCSISLYPEEWARLDKLRGEMSRSRWIAERLLDSSRSHEVPIPRHSVSAGHP